MPIPLTCACGRSFRIRDDLAGRKVRCPSCSGVLLVPVPETATDPEEQAYEALCSEEERAAESRRVSGIRADRDQGTRDLDPEHNPAETGLQRTPPPAPRTPPPGPVRPQPQPRRDFRREEPKRRPLVAFEEGWFGSINAGVAGGLLMVVIAAVWFFGGLALGRIFFFPPILFVIGLGAIFKGIANR